MDWKRLLLVAGGAAGACAVLYYLLREEAEAGKEAVVAEDDEKKKAPRRPRVEEISKEQVVQILDQIIKSQEQMKVKMKEITKHLLANKMTFEETYNRVKDVQPSDPLEVHGLSMQDFDTLLDRHSSDPGVREAIQTIMGAPSPGSGEGGASGGQDISVKNLVEVHKQMHEELETLVKDFQNMPNKERYDLKTVTIAAQALVGTKVQERFGYSTEDIEAAVLQNHCELAKDQEFAMINMQIQQTMGKLLGQQFPQS